MPTATAAAPTSRSRKKKPVFGLVVVGVFVALVICFIVAKLAVSAYLQSEKFRLLVAQKTGNTLRAEVDLLPFQLQGSTVYCGKLSAQGSAESPFAALQLDQMRVDVSARRFFEHVWQIDQVEVQRLRWDVEGPRVTLDKTGADPSKEAAEEHANPGFLPNRVEVGAATVHSTEVQWKDGGLSGTALEVSQREGGWNVSGHGGKLQHGTLPALDLESLKLRYRAPSLFVESADLRQSGSGTLNVTGEIRFEDQFDLQATLNGISVTPFLAEDWRARLMGNLNGTVHTQSALPLRGSAPFSGSLQLSDGHLEALPVLDQIALFTGSAQFRHLALSKTAGDFKYDGSKLTVTHFEMESARLIRIEGDFTVENGQIEGNFQVGVTPPSLQWLPGAQDRVFVTPRGGYLWAPMRLAGPLSNPKEDLSPRLVAAAGGVAVDTAVGIIKNVTGGNVEDKAKALQDATKGIQDTADKAMHLLLGK